MERGLSLLDADKMLDLCKILDINVNELLNGEKDEMKDYNKVTEKLLIGMVKQKEESDKRLLSIEIVIEILITVILLALVFITSFVEMKDCLRTTLILTDFILLVIMVPFTILIEQKAGYYECQKCHHKHILTYSSVLWAMHINRIRYMKCLKCNQRSWQKK